ncbi:MAG: PAS domain-containing hybrid sensor histidine kinase/response regulator [Spirochaetota bacterium]
MNPGRWERMADTFARLGMVEPDHDLGGFLHEPDGGRFDWAHWSLKLLGGTILVLAIAIPLLFSRRLRREVARRRRVNEEYAGILRSAMDGFVVLDDGGRIRDVNEAYCRMAGYTREGLLGMRVSHLEAVESEEDTRAHLRRVRHERSDRFETRHRCRNGAVIDVEVSAMYLEGHGGEGRYLAFVREITERKRAEQAFVESHQRLLTVLDSIDAAIYAADLETYEILFMNRHMRDSFGGDLVGRICYEVFRGETGPCAHCTNDQLLDPEGNPAGVVVWEGKNPITGRWYINYDRAIPWVDGRMVRLQVCTDITEHKHAEEALRESEAQKELILNATVETVQYYDTELRVVWVNRASAASVGASPGELVGRYCYEVWYHRSDPCPGCHVLRARDTGEPQHAETRTPDGRSWLMRAYPVRDEQGRVTALAEFGWDITEQKRAEEENKRLEEQVHQVQRLESLGRLAGGVAHDLNNLLTPILGYGEMLLEDVSDADPRRKPLEEILNAGGRARDLVHRLLAFSRRQVLEFKPVDLNALLTRFYTLLRRTIREDVAIRLDLARSLPMIRGDPGQLEQVVMNMAVNAQDAMPEGGELVIGTEGAVPDGRGGGEGEGPAHGPGVVLTVRDTGCGMNEAAREHLFEPFFTTKGKEEGTGLGLAIVYGIVRQHGGSITLSSEPGNGTTFRIFLPASPENPAPTGMPPGEHTEKLPAGVRGTEVILLVEDNEQVRNLTLAMLAQQGYMVLPAAGGSEALDILEHREDPVDLLLADVTMPGMNGRQLYEQVSGLYPGIKVLYMSGYTHDVIARHGVMDPGVHFIQKPFSSTSLAAKVREVLDH